LQLSQHAPLDDLPGSVRQAFDEGAP